MEKNRLRQIEYLFEHLDLARLELEEIAEDMFAEMSEEERNQERQEGEPASEHDLVIAACENLVNEVLVDLKELLARNGIEVIRTGIDN
ncbi:MAG: hypothetical protein IJX75_00295 [Clostridia bacterium]|nr:hypothetical protein [Clostridia bacterium]